MARPVLVTGFSQDPDPVANPSGDLAAALIRIRLPDMRALVLPQAFGRCTAMVCEAIRRINPAAVLMFGITPFEGPTLQIERFAINCEAASEGDVSGVPVRDRPAVPGGPAAYETTLPAIELVDRLRSRGIDAAPSYSGGTHVCNSLMYGVLHWLADRSEFQTVAGLIHMSRPIRDTDLVRAFAAVVTEIRERISP